MEDPVNYVERCTIFGGSFNKSVYVCDITAKVEDSLPKPYEPKGEVIE